MGRNTLTAVVNNKFTQDVCGETRKFKIPC